MKTCSRCQREKSRTEFSKRAASKDGLCTRCKACVAICNQAWHTANREAILSKKAAYRVVNRDKINVKAATYRATHRDRINAYYATHAGMKTHREGKWRRRGIDPSFTIERYNAMLDRQGHACKLCFNGNTRNGRPLSLEADHDHTTGLVRGLLCNGCNQRLGKVEKHGLNGPHQCSIPFAVRAFLYLAGAADKQQRSAV